MELNTTTIAAVIVFTSIALVGDLRKQRIPNWLTVTAALLGLTWNVFSGGLGGLWLSLGGFATGFGVLLVLWMIGGGGGGDVKMMGAVGAWLGALPTLIVFVSSAGFAIVCAAGIIAWNRYSNSAPQGSESKGSGKQPSVMKQTVPYALPVAMSIWALLLFHAIDA